MTEKQYEGTGLDDLLKRSLADDLPADVAAGMRDRINRFRAGTMRDERRTAAWAWHLRRSAWAALSVLMLVSGSLLQGLGSGNPLAERISLIGIRQAVENRLTAVESMSCSARVRIENGEFMNYEIVWRSGGEGEVRLSAPDGSFLGTFKLGEPGGSHDPLVRAAALFSSPDAVRELLAGAWRLVEFSGEAEYKTETFTTAAEVNAEPLEFTIDLRTYLPVRVTRLVEGSAASKGTRDILWEARFTF